MSLLDRLADRANAVALRRIATRVAATDADVEPEPLSFGSSAVAERLLKGELRFGGVSKTTAQGVAPFGLGGVLWEREAHSFIWLDDLATLASDDAQALARAWTAEWLKRFGTGNGAGWTLPITADRLVRQTNHLIFLRQPNNQPFNTALLHSMRLATQFLAARWSKQRDAFQRLYALAAAVFGALQIDVPIDPSALVSTLAEECRNGPSSNGTVTSRSPDDLERLFVLLVAISSRLTALDQRVPGDIAGVVKHMAPTLRLLRHSDGTLARFHGADRGAEGQLDRALAFSGVRKPARSGQVAMGYCRLAAGRTSLVADVGKPPPVQVSAYAHASALAFELTSGRRPVIVSAGPGENFGPDWALAGRATPSHSTLAFSGLSQARIAARGKQGPDDPVLLDHGPTEVTCRVTRSEDGTLMVAAHNAYVPSHGMWHQRALRLSLDGRQLEGVDLLEARGKDDEVLFRTAQTKRPDSFAFAIRLHLHPHAQAGVALNGAAVAITLRSGEVWMLRHDGTCDVSLEPSVWLTRDEDKPVASEQIVLSTMADEMERRVRWTLSKAQDTPRGIRDLHRDDPHS